MFLGLAGWAFFSWRRYGKDPVYLDDPSILMPAPPPDLTAASGAFVLDGGTSRRALTTAMLDLASRGLIAFREEKGLLGLSTKVGIDTAARRPSDAVEEAQPGAQRAPPDRPGGGRRPAAAARPRRLASTSSSPTTCPSSAPPSTTSTGRSRATSSTAGWLVEKPSKVVSRWVGRGVIAIILGVVAGFIGINVPISGLVLVGGAAIAGGIVICLFAQGMPTVTMPGAMIRAMLAAYRRTLQKTMEQSRSMQQVVDGAGLIWLETPDQAVVWGTALGLQHEIESVLSRSLEDVETGGAALANRPTSRSGIAARTARRSRAPRRPAAAGRSSPGSAVPDLGGMMSALGTIGNSPSSSGSSGGGGFSGGGSGGGGGGAGGGF